MKTVYTISAMRPDHPIKFTITAVFLIVFLSLKPGWAENGNYQIPGPGILPIMDVPATSLPLVSPDQKHLLLINKGGLPSVETLARPYIGLAGIRIDMDTNTQVDYGLARSMTLFHLDPLEDIQIQGLPEDSRIVKAAWSSDSRYIAASVLTNKGLELWVTEVRTGEARPLYTKGLNNVLGSSFAWVPGQNRLICQILPKERGPRPQVNKHRLGPKISDTSGRQTPVRTYRNLLQSLYDEILFDYMAKSSLALIDMDGTVSPISPPQLFRRVSPSPDGNYLLVEIIQYPYSYLLPHDRFPYRVEILDLRGKPVKELASLPLADQIPLGALAVPEGPRAFNWEAGKPATIWWARALDDGNHLQEADFRDELFRLSAPFTDDPKPVYKTRHRFWRLLWGLGKTPLVVEIAPDNGMIRSWHINPDQPGSEPRLLYKRMKRNDKDYPDIPLVRSGNETAAALQVPQPGNTMFLFEERPTPNNERCFLKALDTVSLEEKIIWTSDPGFYEKPIAMLDKKGKIWLTQRESFEAPPNFFILNLEKETLSPIRLIDHPAPQTIGITRERIFYKRKDGVPLTADLYLPPGYSPDQGPLPTLLWIYPRAYAGIENTAPRKGMETRFIHLGRTSRMYWPLMGYALVDRPFLPIVGNADGRPNDTFVSQLTMGAEAVINTLVERGISQKDRIAVGGHSYGAFATANLLAHTDLFAAGIARSGAYNRTLTPFGFQHEFRDLWREPELYFKISPFNHAAGIKAPILLIHGELDQNTGTFPEQSQRFYHALKGLGATARLVMLPYEDHSYFGSESILHMIWEMQQWLNIHIREKPGGED